MTFEEWDKIRKNSLEMVEKTVCSLKDSQDSELAKLFGSTYTDSVTDEIREYTKTATLSVIEEDLHQIAVALNKVAGELTNAPRVMFKAPEATSRMSEWIPKEMNGRIEYYECPICGCSEPETRNYCPHCGEKMFVKTHDVCEEFLKEAIHDTE